MSESRILYIATGTIVVILAIFGIVMYFSMREVKNPTPDRLEYNGFVFLHYADLWNTEWQRDNNLYSIHFHYSPLEAESVPILQRNPLDERFDQPTYYMTFDPLANNTEYFKVAVGELHLTLIKVFGRDLVAACTGNVTGACYKRPIITCDNSTQGAVFYLKQSGEPSIILDGNCVTITGEDKELVRAVDRLLYHWYRIIPPPEEIQIIG